MKKQEKPSLEVEADVNTAWSRARSAISLESLVPASMDLASHITTSPGKRNDLSRMAVDHLQLIEAVIKGGLLQSANNSEGMKLPPLWGVAMIAPT